MKKKQDDEASQTDRLKAMQLAVNRVYTCVRLFRNNVGMGWVGKVTRLTSGNILIKFPRPLHAGLVVGSLDTIGWYSHTIRAEDVGKKVAIFAAAEDKSQGDPLSEEQKTFIKNVKEAGGIAGIFYTPEDAIELFRNPLQNVK